MNILRRSGQKIKKRLLRKRAKYQPSFSKTHWGNGLRFTEPLKIRIKGAEIVAARIYSETTNKTYQIDQSHPNDKDKDVETVEFTMKSKLHPEAKAPEFFLPKGKYVLFTWWWDNDTMRGGTHKDNFVIA